MIKNKLNPWIYFSFLTRIEWQKIVVPPSVHRHAYIHTCSPLSNGNAHQRDDNPGYQGWRRPHSGSISRMDRLVVWIVDWLLSICLSVYVRHLDQSASRFSPRCSQSDADRQLRINHEAKGRDIQNENGTAIADPNGSNSSLFLRGC